MKYKVLKRKYIWRLILFIALIPTLVLCGILFYIQTKQADILQNQLLQINKSHAGLIKIGDSDLSLFKNFPYTSVKINNIQIYETKLDTAAIMDVDKIYIGFSLWDIINQNYDVQSIIIEDGFLNVILHEDGTNNFENALKTNDSLQNDSALDIHLKKIKLKNLDVHKLDESSNLDIETFIYWANGGFKTLNDNIEAHVDSEFELNVLKEGDTTYIKHKHFKFDTDLSYNGASKNINIKPTNIEFEHADFELAGSVNILKDPELDLKFKGQKSNFDMLIAFAPHDLIPVLEKYNNAGNIYFNAIFKGPLSNKELPFIDVNFGTNKAYLENPQKKKRISDLGFNGHFTNGVNRNLESMEFSLQNMSAKLERGNFLGSLIVKNFEHPDIRAQINADFNIKFIADFFNIKSIQNTSGNIELKMNFHDIIDINQPELALNNLNQAYFSELTVKDLSITFEDLPAQLKNLNARFVMKGDLTTIEKFNMLMGDSDLNVEGTLTNLPSIIHKTNDSVKAHLDISSKLLDIAALKSFNAVDSTGVDEQIRDLSIGLSFESLARDFSSFEYLPKGEFFVDSLHAKLKHYPHEFHDFHADVLINNDDLEIIDFTGYIDASDFHFNGYAHNYSFWFNDTLEGDVDLDLKLNSTHLRLEDVFAYKGENYVPEEYRHEVFDDLDLSFSSAMHCKDSKLQTIDLDVENVQTKMQIHPNTFEDFSGHFHYENEQLLVNDFKGKIGDTDFDVDLTYYLGDDSSNKKQNNSFKLKADYIDFDAFIKFNPEPIEDVVVTNELEDVKAHLEGFNIYELPFTDMTFNVDVKRLKYHRIDLKNIKGQLRTTEDHYIYVDTLNLDSAGGNFKLSGYFNGSDPEHIYFKPKLSLNNVDIDRLAFKFENFGQDHLVSENLHGKLTSEITGNIRVYPDMIPDLDQSDIQMNVRILEGRLENYEPMELFSDYIGDKNLKKIRFDTLQNNIAINKGKIDIPNMTIESTLGHIEMSGTHDSEHNIEYYLRIPWKTVRKASLYKIFGNKKKVDSIYEEEEIIKVDRNKRTRYLNLKIIGTVDDFDISLGKKKNKKTN